MKGNAILRLCWFVIVGIPLLVICFVGVLAAWLDWDWLDLKCRHWFDEMLP